MADERPTQGVLIAKFTCRPFAELLNTEVYPGWQVEFITCTVGDTNLLKMLAQPPAWKSPEPHGIGSEVLRDLPRAYG
jgi:hypothetical protein